MASWKVGASRSLPIAHRDSWDGNAARQRMVNASAATARRGHLVYDADGDPTAQATYKLPFADIVNGTLTAIDAGLRAAANRLPQADIPQSVKDQAREILDHYFTRIESEASSMPLPDSLSLTMHSEPHHDHLQIGGLAVDDARRRELRQQLDAGELDCIEFDAIVYIDGPNANHYRFRSRDLHRFAASFINQPFLRNHDTHHIESRDGTIEASSLVLATSAFMQTIKLTTERGMRSFAQGQIDRFSIGWYFDAITCSVCNQDWFRCDHWPGRTYRVKDQGGNDTDVLCELIFENPRGKETSAVNAPAVDGTQILAQLCEHKRVLQEDHQEGVKPMSTSTAPAPAAEEVQVETPPPASAVDLPIQAPLPEPAPQAARAPLPEPAPQAAQAPPPAPQNAGPAVPMTEWVSFLQQQALQTALASSGLPTAFQNAVRDELNDRPITPQLVEAAIARQRRVWSQLQEDEVIRGLNRPIDGVRLHGMTTPLDRMQEAVNWIFGVQGATPPPPSLRRIDNIYMALTGDYNWHGIFDPDNAQLSNANTTTLADMATNAMNVVIVNMWPGLAMYRWFEDLVAVQPHDGSIHPMQWVQFGGISNLNTVDEGAAYTEKTVADSKEADSFTKYGNFVGITLEMIRRSQIAKIQAVPKALAVAAVRTRSAAIASLFTVNSDAGPTLDDDSTALFHANHGNLATTAFSWTAWKASRIECAKQTELGSSKRQGLWPRYGLFPIDLWDDALVTFGYGQGTGGKPSTADNDVNPFGVDKPGDPRPIPIVVPEWTDTNNWAYLVDPRLHPVIQMSYAQAPNGGQHPTPELFTVTSPGSGLVFTNDTLPIKIRDWFAYGVATWRGIGKRNVA